MIAKREVFCSRNVSSDTNKINVKNTRGTSTGPCMAWQWSWIVIGESLLTSLFTFLLISIRLT